jgi:hypothetical protein
MSSLNQKTVPPPPALAYAGTETNVMPTLVNVEEMFGPFKGCCRPYLEVAGLRRQGQGAFRR